MKITLIAAILFSLNIYSQNVFSNIWDKDHSVFNANEFLVKNVLNSSSGNVVKFNTDALTAANSGEITTVLYKKEEGDLEGLLLCFYGSYWNDSGVVFTGYGFKNLNKEKAFEFLNLIQKNINDSKDYLTKGGTTSYSGNNIFFKYDDINILIGYIYGSLTIRLFWQKFDSSWNNSAFEKSKRRFEKRIN